PRSGGSGRRSLQLAIRPQRRRAGGAGGPEPLCRSVRGKRLRSAGVDARLRALRGVAGGDVHARGPRAALHLRRRARPGVGRRAVAGGRRRRARRTDLRARPLGDAGVLRERRGLGFVRDGELFVSGRAKDIVILRGENHSPQEFEEALDGIAGVRPGCAAAVGLPTPEGEVLALLVEADGAANPEEIRSRVTERTGIRPDQVHLLAPGTLPRTSSGKLRRGEALRQLQSGELRPPDRVTILHIARETARSLMARLRG